VADRSGGPDPAEVSPTAARASKGGTVFRPARVRAVVRRARRGPHGGRWTGRRGSGPTGLGAAVGLAVALLCALPLGTAARPPAATGPVAGSRGPSATPVYSSIPYNASTDGFPLAYGEILPAGYRPTISYPLLVYMRGEGNNSTIISGGAGDGLLGWNDTTKPYSNVLIPLVDNASMNHFIMIGPSPRSGQGFYTNSPCGGPEEQDTMDAILHEESLRHISSVYMLGYSMGSLGAISFVGHHASMFRGLALAGTLTDAFEEFAYHPSPWGGLASLTCGVLPSPTNTSVDALFSYLSVLRFHPQNFSGVRIWVAAGGNDKSATNNLAIWPWQQVNNTFVNSTCLVESTLGEPANCTNPIGHLHVRNPANYSFRFVFEPAAGHSLAQIDPSDMFRFLLGRELGGCVETTFPPAAFTACP